VNVARVESEPNDTPETADALGLQLCGAIENATDVDHFVLVADAPVLLFEAAAGAALAVTAPSGVTYRREGTSTYASSEQGRFAIQVTSRSAQRQSYVITLQ
jgi:hypothetical protein